MTQILAFRANVSRNAYSKFEQVQGAEEFLGNFQTFFKGLITSSNLKIVDEIQSDDFITIMKTVGIEYVFIITLN